VHDHHPVVVAVEEGAVIRPLHWAKRLRRRPWRGRGLQEKITFVEIPTPVVDMLKVGSVVIIPEHTALAGVAFRMEALDFRADVCQEYCVDATARPPAWITYKLHIQNPVVVVVRPRAHRRESGDIVVANIDDRQTLSGTVYIYTYIYIYIYIYKIYIYIYL